MISLIICSRNSDIPQSLKENIAETIGLEYELIVIDNSKSKYSIFQAYNIGVKRANYPYLCFMHEDILYYTKDWGKIVVGHFEDEKVGCIGVIGSHCLPETLAYWDNMKPYLSGVVPSVNGITHSFERYREGKTEIPVVTVDGMWFCIKKSSFEIIQFDESLYSGFHFYDMDISMQVSQMLKKQVLVVFDILIGHYSYASINPLFLRNMNLFYDKWKSKLPLVIGIDDCDSDVFSSLSSLSNYYYICYNAYYDVCEQNKKLHSSKAYRLGKLILKPFSFLRGKLFE